jgi:hypothetical protein
VLSTGGYGFKYFSVRIEVLACVTLKNGDERDSPETEPPTQTPATEQTGGGGGTLQCKTYCNE